MAARVRESPLVAPAAVQVGEAWRMQKAQQAAEIVERQSGTVVAGVSSAMARPAVEHRACREPLEARQAPRESPAWHALWRVVVLPVAGSAELRAAMRLHLHRKAQTCACTHPPRVVERQPVEFAPSGVTPQRKVGGP